MSRLLAVALVVAGVVAHGCESQSLSDAGPNLADATSAGDAAGEQTSPDANSPGDGQAPDHSADLPAVTYPKCRVAGISLWACHASKTCVKDCATCKDAPIHCQGTAGCPDLADPVPTRFGCVATCAECSQLSGLDVPDQCNGTCVDLAEDLCHCGSCGNQCPQSFGGTSSCQMGHCCPDPNGPSSPSFWNESCKACCLSLMGPCDGCVSEL